MMLLLVAYDLHQPHRTYPPVEAAIKASGTWAHVEESVWVVDTLLTPQDLLQRLRNAADGNDTFFIIQLQQNWWSVNLTQGVVDWLKHPERRW